MAARKTIAELNRELAEKLAKEGLDNPQHPYFGKFVGIANGQVMVVADGWDEVLLRLREVESDPSKTFGVEVGRDYDVIEEVWTVC